MLNVSSEYSFNLNMNDADNYRGPDLYEKIISWCALLRTSEMLSTEKSDGFVHKIYGETLSPELEFFTENIEEKIKMFLKLVEEGHEINN